MKTPEQWAKRVQNSKEPWAKLVAEIQSDAHQQGLTDAAEIYCDAQRMNCLDHCDDYAEAIKDCKHAILTARAAAMPNIPS